MWSDKVSPPVHRTDSRIRTHLRGACPSLVPDRNCAARSREVLRQPRSSRFDAARFSLCVPTARHSLKQQRLNGTPEICVFHACFVSHTSWRLLELLTLLLSPFPGLEEASQRGKLAPATDGWSVGTRDHGLRTHGGQSLYLLSWKKNEWKRVRFSW